MDILLLSCARSSFFVHFRLDEDCSKEQCYGLQSHYFERLYEKAFLAGRVPRFYKCVINGIYEELYAIRGETSWVIITAKYKRSCARTR